MDLKAIELFEFINIKLEAIPKHIIFYYLFKPVLYHPIILSCHQSPALTPSAALYSSCQMDLPVSGEDDCIFIT